MPPRPSRTRALRLALPWALTVVLGLVVAGTALSSGDRGLFSLFGNGRRASEPRTGLPHAADPSGDTRTKDESSGDPPARNSESATRDASRTELAVALPENEPRAVESAANDPAPIDDTTDSPDVEAWLDAVVSLETGPAESRERLGAGLLVSAEGDVLTCLHVVRGLRSVTVVLRDGAAYEAVGYAGIDEERDLALLRLERSPDGATVFPIERTGEASRLEPIVALGHPEGSGFAAFEGAVSNVLRPDDLPARSRRFLDEELGASGDALWIQHTARLLPGCSGGPLLSRSGELLGIDAWNDQEAGLGYALAARHAVDLVERAKSDGNVEALVEVAARHIDWRNLERDLSAENVERTLAAADAFDWRPESEDDYRMLRELAALVTFANQTSHALRSQSGLEESVVQELRTASDRAETILRAKRWDPLVQLPLVNDGADRTLDDPQGGCFLFVTAVESFVGPSGSSGFVATLTGGERRVFLRTDSLLESPPVGSHWLALAIRQQNETVRFGANPLDPEVVPQLRVGALIPLELP